MPHQTAHTNPANALDIENNILFTEQKEPNGLFSWTGNMGMFAKDCLRNIETTPIEWVLDEINSNLNILFNGKFVAIHQKQFINTYQKQWYIITFDILNNNGSVYARLTRKFHTHTQGKDFRKQVGKLVSNIVRGVAIPSMHMKVSNLQVFQWSELREANLNENH